MATMCILPDAYYRPPPLETTIKELYGVDYQTKKPINVQELSERIGKEPSLLLCAMLAKNSNCSVFGVKCLIEILASITGNNHISLFLDYSLEQKTTRPLNFVLKTSGFLNHLVEEKCLELGDRNLMHVGFSFKPEYSISKQELTKSKNDKTSYALDLSIDLGISFLSSRLEKKENKKKAGWEEIHVATVIVEFDGLTHLNDEKVRTDKLRDSNVQSNGSTVFRIQMPYQHQGKDSTELNRDNLEKILEEHIRNIKNHFQSRLLATLNSNRLLESLIE